MLSGALPDIRPAMSLNELRDAVQIGSLTPYVISVGVKGKAAAMQRQMPMRSPRAISAISVPQAARAGKFPRSCFSRTSATGSDPIKQIIIYALVGAIAGALIGAIIALAISRSDRRLRERDEIADSIGVPVLASFPVDHPADPKGWTKLLEDYKPGALHALQLRRAIQQLEMAAADVNVTSQNGWSVTVLSLSSDPRALALGPQLAIFAASQGIPTALVIGPQQDATVTATLRTACAAPAASSQRPTHLRVLVTDSDVEVPPDAELTVVVAVVDGRSPRVPDTIRTTAAVLGVSAGAATADQLARATVSAASNGREITGILVADPDSDDATTGRLPQLGRRGQQKMPTRMNGIATETRR